MLIINILTTNTVFMKQNRYFFVALLLLAIIFVASCNTNKPQEPLSYDDAKEIVLQLYDTDSMDIYMAPTVLPANSIVCTMYDSLTSPKSNCWYIFVDKAPLANWLHPCDYVFVTEDKGVVVIEPNTCPPKEMDLLELISRHVQ